MMMMRDRASVALLVIIAVLAPATSAVGGRTTSPEVIVWLDRGRDPATLMIGGVETVEPVIASRGVYRVKVATKSAEPKDVERATKNVKGALGALDGVRWAETAPDVEVSDTRFHAWPSGLPIDTTLEALQSQPALADLELEHVHELTTGAGVVVAVLDTGVDPNHTFIRDSLLPGYDMVSDDDDPTEQADGLDGDLDGTTDRAFGHGTYVAGLIHQLAPAARIVPIRVLDDEGNGSLPAIVEGINFAIDSGATIINLSLGVSGKVGFPPVRAALKRAKASGATLVAAAGNMGDRREYFPADAADVISVTAVDTTRHLATFANRGKWVDVGAPGVDLLSSAPAERYVSWGGTSASAAIVSGELALLTERLGDTATKVLTTALWKSCRKGLQGQATHGTIDILEAVLGSG